MNASKSATFFTSGASCTRCSAGTSLLDEMGRDRLVGQEHELLDEPVRDVPLRRDDRFDPPYLGEDDFGFGQIEVDRPAAAPPLIAGSRTARASARTSGRAARYSRDRVRVAIGQDGVDGRVGHPRVAVDHAVVNLVAHDVAAPVDFHQARLHQPIDVRIETAESRRQLRREHVHGSLGEIHRRAALVGFFVERAALLHVVRDVGDVHAEPVVAVRQPLDRDRIVEVARVLAVDRDGRRPARKSVRPWMSRSLDRPAEPLRFLDRVFGVRVRDVELADDDLRVDAGLVDVAEHFDDASDRTAGGGRPPRDLDEHHVSRLGR